MESRPDGQARTASAAPPPGGVPPAAGPARGRATWLRADAAGRAAHRRRSPHGPGHAVRRDQAHARRRPHRGDRRAPRPRAGRPAPPLLPHHRGRRNRVRDRGAADGDAVAQRAQGAGEVGTRVMGGERAYRALLFLYPRRFRREYRDPVLQLYRDARRDHSSSWPRLAGDVVLSAPAQHKEAFRTMSTQGKLVLASVVTGIAIVAFMFVGGALLALALMLLSAWILARLLRERDAQVSVGFWWKLTLSGVGVFAVTFLIFAGPWPQSWRDAVPGELGWWSGIFLFSAAIVTIVAGLFSGVVQLASRRWLTH